MNTLKRKSTKEKVAINNHENGTSQKMAYIYNAVAATEKDLIFRIFYS